LPNWGGEALQIKMAHPQIPLMSDSSGLNIHPREVAEFGGNLIISSEQKPVFRIFV